jgi:hypothetical protein
VKGYATRDLVGHDEEGMPRECSKKIKEFVKYLFLNREKCLFIITHSKKSLKKVCMYSIY